LCHRWHGDQKKSTAILFELNISHQLKFVPSLAYIINSDRFMISQETYNVFYRGIMATLKDISKKTGVSIRTVSRALKNDAAFDDRGDFGRRRRVDHRNAVEPAPLGSVLLLPTTRLCSPRRALYWSH
jgi:hypothetical protein